MQKSEIKQVDGIEQWFDNLVATLRSHQLQLDSTIASDELKKFYDTMFSGNADQISHFGKLAAQKHFVTRIIFDYLSVIKPELVNKLAFYFNDSEVLVWAEIQNDQEEIEKKLLKAEAEINARYHPYGFDMETTIVEQRDGLKVPNHYQPFK